MKDVLKREFELVNMIFKRRLQEAEELAQKIRPMIETNKEQAEAHLFTLNNLYKKVNESANKLKELKDKIIDEIEKDF